MPETDVDEKGYNDRICFLIDMSLPSGSSRFFVYNLKTDTLQNSGLVTHGRCNQQWLEGRVAFLPSIFSSVELLPTFFNKPEDDNQVAHTRSTKTSKRVFGLSMLVS